MLESHALSKRFGGTLAVDKVSFNLNRGEILGYLGPNGSGKSTTVNIVVGLLEPSSGTVTLDGRTLSEDPPGYQRKVGYVPEEPYLYTHLTSTEYSRWSRAFAAFRPRQSTGKSQSSSDCFSCTTADIARCAPSRRGCVSGYPDGRAASQSGLADSGRALRRARCECRTVVPGVARPARGGRPDDSLQHASLRHGREAVFARRDSVEWA